MILVHPAQRNHPVRYVQHEQDHAEQLVTNTFVADIERLARRSYRLFLFQDATGNRVPTWPQVPAGNWANDAGTPQPQLTASKLTVYDFTYDGANWYGGAANTDLMT